MGEQRRKKNITVGLLAHVDAGKTTLSEQLLYKTGAIGKIGRVDHKDTFLDTHSLERERGITIFSKQAIFSVESLNITLLDTPGHVDFGGEMERTLQVLDYAILVINGSDGVQSHTKTLWKLLKKYEIPVFIFVNKMDREENQKEQLMADLKSRLDNDCIDFNEDNDKDYFYDEVAVRDEELMEAFLEGKLPEEKDIGCLINERKLFPCLFGSALKDMGIDYLLKIMSLYMQEREYQEEFAARVYKIGRDETGRRLTYLKVTGGELKVKQVIEETEAYGPKKVEQLRLYHGSSYENILSAACGQVVAVIGPVATYAGQPLGVEKGDFKSLLEPVLTYGIILPENENFFQAYDNLKILEEEDPNLHIVKGEGSQDIYCKVMGEIQMQVLKEAAFQRFGLDIEFTSGEIVYKESVACAVEGVGHFEPLRHYAEVHVLLEPLPPGSGIQIDTVCSEDVLDRNWQRLILTHFLEKEHKGVLTGAALTDTKITLLTGKAHNKHTEGGDFRQATYRAIRQGLRRGGCTLLEPVYDFNLEVPTAMVGRAMADLKMMSADFTLHQKENDTEFSILTGSCPVSTMQEYQSQIPGYTKGLGRLECSLKGYLPCHNSEEVIEERAYSADGDVENPCGSIFCSHGSGVYIDWDKVEEHMHLEYVCCPEEKQDFLSKEPVVRKEKGDYKVIGTEEIDAILSKTFYANKKGRGNDVREGWQKRKGSPQKEAVTKIYKGAPKKEEYLLVDGYNIIFAWQDLKEVAGVSLDGARGKLQDTLCDYQAMRGIQTMVVFDAYRLQGHPVEVFDYNNIKVVFTKEAETADQYIEKFTAKHASEYNITVATSDGLEQIIIRGQGCRLMSATDLKDDILRNSREFKEQYMKEEWKDKVYLREIMPDL